MICPSCGGEYADWALKCPYCDTVNDSASEKLYMEHMEEVRQRLDLVDDEAEDAYIREVGSGVRKTFKIAVILAIIVTAIVCITLVITSVNEKKDEALELDQIKWEEEEFPKLDSWYESGDIDSIYEEYQNLLLSDSNYNLYKWSHYEFCCEYYGYYKNMQSVKAYLEKGETERVDSYILGLSIYAALYINRYTTEARLDTLTESYKKSKNYGLTEDEADIIRSWSADAEEFLKIDLKMSSSEIDSLYEKSLNKEADFLSVGEFFDYADSMAKTNRWGYYA